MFLNLASQQVSKNISEYKERHFQKLRRELKQSWSTHFQTDVRRHERSGGRAVVIQ